MTNSNRKQRAASHAGGRWFKSSIDHHFYAGLKHTPRFVFPPVP